MTPGTYNLQLRGEVRNTLTEALISTELVGLTIAAPLQTSAAQSTATVMVISNSLVTDGYVDADVLVDRFYDASSDSPKEDISSFNHAYWGDRLRVQV